MRIDRLFPLVNYVSFSREFFPRYVILRDFSNHYAKRIICHSPVGKQHQRLGEDIPQEGGRGRHVRQNDGRENTADSGTASVLRLVPAKVDRQVSKQTIMRGRQGRQQLFRQGDP